MKYKLTIGIPSYNRGEVAIAGVEAIIDNIPEGVQIIVSDNGSIESNQYYEKIAQLAKYSPEKLTYHKNNSNLGFVGNLMKLIEISNSDWLIFCSDEDTININYVQEILQTEASETSIGIIRGSIAPQGNYRGNSITYPDLSFNRGLNAIKHFGMHNNYLSGVAYNLHLLQFHGILKKWTEGIWAHSDYPHLYLDALVCAFCDVKITSTISCLEGTPAAGEDQAAQLKYKSPYTLGARLDQFWGTQKAVFEALDLIPDQATPENYFEMYILVCKKYLNLIVNSDAFIYQRNNLEIKQIVDCFGSFMKASIPKNYGYEGYVKLSWSIDKLIAGHIEKILP